MDNTPILTNMTTIYNGSQYTTTFTAGQNPTGPMSCDCYQGFSCSHEDHRINRWHLIERPVLHRTVNCTPPTDPRGIMSCECDEGDRCCRHDHRLSMWKIVKHST